MCVYRSVLQWGGPCGADQWRDRGSACQQKAAECQGALEEGAGGGARASEGINTWSHTRFCFDLELRFYFLNFWDLYSRFSTCLQQLAAELLTYSESEVTGILFIAINLYLMSTSPFFSIINVVYLIWYCLYILYILYTPQIHVHLQTLGPHHECSDSSEPRKWTKRSKKKHSRQGSKKQFADVVFDNCQVNKWTYKTESWKLWHYLTTVPELHLGSKFNTLFFFL